MIHLWQFAHSTWFNLLFTLAFAFTLVQNYFRGVRVYWLERTTKNQRDRIQNQQAWIKAYRRQIDDLKVQRTALGKAFLPETPAFDDTILKSALLPEGWDQCD